MSWELGLQAVETAAVALGVLFGLVQLRHLRTQREIQTAVELLHPLQGRDFAQTIMIIHNLPEGLDEAALKKRLGDDFGAVLALIAVFESLGPLVARGYIPLPLYADFYRGPTTLCWAKFHRYIEAKRAAGWPMLYEWVQWLVEALERAEDLPGTTPAFERFSRWRSHADFERLVRSAT